MFVVVYNPSHINKLKDFRLNKNHSVNAFLHRSPVKESERSSMSGFSWQDSRPFHAQKKTHDSSSWLDLTPNFRQEIRQSHYRNDPVKYDLAKLGRGQGESINCAQHCVCIIFYKFLLHKTDCCIDFELKIIKLVWHFQ